MGEPVHKLQVERATRLLHVNRHPVQRIGPCLDRLQLFPDQIHGQHLVLVAAGGPGAHAGEGAQRPARALLDEVVGAGGRGIADGERDGQALVHVKHEQEDGQAPRCHNCKNSSDIEYNIGSVAELYLFFTVTVLVPAPNLDHKKHSFSSKNLLKKILPFYIPGTKLFYKENFYNFRKCE